MLGSQLETFLKRDSRADSFCEFSEIFNYNFCTKRLQATSLERAF